MYGMRYLILSLMVMLTACGGGGSSTKANNNEPSQMMANLPINTTLEVEKNVTEETTPKKETESTLSTVSISTAPHPTQALKMVVNAGEDRDATLNQPITLTGTVTNAGTKKLTYSWIKGSELLATTRSFDYTPKEEDALPTAGHRVDVLTFTVRTERGESLSDMVNITVLNR